MSENKNVTSIAEAPSYMDRLDDRNRMYRRRRGAVAAGALVAAAAFALAGKGVVDWLNRPSFEERVEATVEANPTVFRGKIILREGVKLRAQPLMNNGGDGEQDNVLDIVGEGEALILDHPVLYKNQANQEFLGAIDKDGNYLWVNAEQVQEDENASGKNYITYVRDPGSGEWSTNVKFDNGRFYQGAGNEHVVATASTVPISEID